MMRTHPGLRLAITLTLMLMLFQTPGSSKTHASTDDAWWDNDWPYRIPITLANDGVVGINLNFSQLLNQLGLNEALLDLRSIRVIPYKNGAPGKPVPYEETYSQLIINADTDDNWLAEESTDLIIDNQYLTQGTGAIHAHIEITDSSLTNTGFAYHINEPSLADWSDYEILFYDIFPEVNEIAIDQTPDLFHFELIGVENCSLNKIKGPGLKMNTWHSASVSLRPYSNCPTADLSNLQSLRFFVYVDTIWASNGNFEPGGVLDLWLDNFRLVDQDGSGQIIWTGKEDVDKYYIYFDTPNHEGHPAPELIDLPAPSITANPGGPEAGGYFHQIDGVNDSQLVIWTAPITEKILPDIKVPITSQPLSIQAARGELEAFQLVINPSTDLTRTIKVTDFVNSAEDATIPTSQIDLFRVDYIELSRLSDQYGRLGSWPDPLFPLINGQSVNFIAGQNQPLWFRIKVRKDAAPGFYHGSIVIGETAVPITLQVWNFVLPETTLLESQFGFDWTMVMATYQAAACENEFKAIINHSFNDYRLMPSEPDLPPSGQIYTLSNYEIQSAQNDQTKENEKFWWQFNPYDTPPFANPAVIDRPGVDARILPWIAWLDRIDGLYYPQTTSWANNPWTNPMDDYGSNGNNFFFYPPNEELLTYPACSPERNRLIPSIRLELLREGLEDYAYLWLLNGVDPIIGVENQSDSLAKEIIQSETLFSRIPTSFDAIRSEIALILEPNEPIENSQLYFPLVFH